MTFCLSCKRLRLQWEAGGSLHCYTPNRLPYAHMQTNLEALPKQMARPTRRQANPEGLPKQLARPTRRLEV